MLIIHPAKAGLLYALALCMTLCACRAGVFAADVGAGMDSASAVASPSACCRHGDHHRSPSPIAPCDRFPDEPGECCGICCIKGTGLNHIELIPEPTVSAPAAATPASLALIGPQRDAVTIASGAFRRTHAPPAQTLLRLHCALVV